MDNAITDGALAVADVRGALALPWPVGDQCMPATVPGAMAEPAAGLEPASGEEEKG